MKKELRKRVFLGMSGGVDSSVSALLLKKQGYDVVGVFIKTWHPDFIKCNEEEERFDAMRVAAHLDIPFLTFDFEDIYKKEVSDYMIREYKKGNTPNPDVMCNKEIKFGAFFKKAISMGADYVATGHYAQINISGSKNNLFYIKKGKDELKDQSYFLWTIKKEQLPRIIFPIGNLKKDDVRVIAKRSNIPVAEKKDSQGICFLGAIDLKDFLKHYIKEKKGLVLNGKGEEIGFHNGVFFYTLGERHGFVISKKNPKDTPYYVIKKDIKKNILVVSQDRDLSRINYNRIKSSKYILKNINNTEGSFKKNMKYTAQIRYHGELLFCKVRTISNNRIEIIFEKDVLVDKGQSCVIYNKDTILAGGVIL